MASKLPWKQRAKRLIFFFPFQLVLVHIQSNHMLLLSWLFITGMVTDSVLAKYGASNLFLYPEYLGEVNFVSHFLMGLSVGGFIMSFNIASYILNGYKFPILATLNRPFTKYSLNNSLIPIGFLAIYLYQLFTYQTKEELEPLEHVLWNIAGLFMGIGLFISITLSYFLTTNKSVQSIFGDIRKNKPKPRVRPVGNVFSRTEPWYSFLSRKREWKVSTYLATPYRISLARAIDHYDERMLRTVFAQNHVNASIFELLTIAAIIFFGLYRETPLFKLPAAASIMLILTMVLMLTSAIYSWLRGWSTLAFILILLGYNLVSQNPRYSFQSYAYGLRYNEPLATYSNEQLKAHSRDTAQLDADLANGLEILENWRKHNEALTPGRKPKVVFINCSGGGLRAAAWSARVMQYLDSTLNGNLMTHTHFLSGSSGGMIGAAYMREVHFRQLQDSTFAFGDYTHFDNISKDLLNAVALNFSLHDWLIRIRQFEYEGQRYTKDRGYAFERQLSENTGYVLDKTMSDYTMPEYYADIPLMMLAPTITNDGRQLLIGSQPVSYLTQTDFLDNLNHAGLVESVDYRQLFAAHNADSLSILSALRMNATFFYILPNVLLPTDPLTEVMDAGVRDNYGTLNTVRYITAFKDWINEHTSGVVIIQIRDRYKTVDIETQTQRSFVTSLIRPIEAVYDNYLKMQEYSHDGELMQLSGLLKNKLSVLNFQLKRTRSRDISLSWHLTNKEKQRIYDSMNEPENQTSVEILQRLILGPDMAKPQEE